MRSFGAALLLCAFTGSVAVAIAPYGSVKPYTPPEKCEAVPLATLLPPKSQDRIEAETPRADKAVQLASIAPVDEPLPFRDERIEPQALPVTPPPRPRDLADPKPVKPTVKETWLLDEARKFIGKNPTGWGSLWCARFMAMLAPDLAKKIDNPNWARDWGDALRKTKPAPGAIAVLKRGKGGHIGVVSHIDKHGNPVIVSGNACGRAGHRVVCERTFPKTRVLAYVSASN